jgi:Helicase conserved C-terminal domain
MDRVDETVINYDLIEDVLNVLFLESESPFTPPSLQGADSVEDTDNEKLSLSGAVLVFMPGIGEIRSLAERLSGSRSYGNSQRFEIVPLHSTLSSVDQKKAFKPSPKGCRKVIISTNIAETRSVASFRQKPRSYLNISSHRRSAYHLKNKALLFRTSYTVSSFAILTAEVRQRRLTNECAPIQQ